MENFSVRFWNMLVGNLFLSNKNQEKLFFQ